MTAKAAEKQGAAEPAPISKEQRDAELADLAALEAKIAERRRQLGATGLEAVPQSEFHVWPDGSSAVGCPPFPDESPKQRAARAAREHAVAHTGADMIPPSMKRSGVVTADTMPGAGPAAEPTEAELQQLVEAASTKNEAPAPAADNSTK